MEDDLISNNKKYYVVMVLAAVLLILVVWNNIGFKDKHFIKTDNNNQIGDNINVNHASNEDVTNVFENNDEQDSATNDVAEDITDIALTGTDSEVDESDTSNKGERYFTEKLSVDEMKIRSENISKKDVKQLLYNEIDEHWDVLSKKLNQKDKKKVQALFLGFATRESTLNAGVETGHTDGFGVNPAHAFGPLQTAVTAYKGCNDSFDKEDDVPELYQYEWNEENFYDPIVSTHMGVRKFIHFINEVEAYGLKDIEIIRGALKGFNTGHANNEKDNMEYYANYPDEIGALSRWYYENEHYYDEVFTWTSDPRVDRDDCWGWWKY